MAINSDATKHGGGGGGELEKRMTAVEVRLGVIERTMVTTEVFERELGGLRGEIRAVRDDLRGEIGTMRDDLRGEIGTVRVELAKIPFEVIKWLIALSGIAAAIATTVYNIWFR